VGRQHLKLDWTTSGWQIYLQPGAGQTTLNGEALKEVDQVVLLRSGDQIVVGSTVLRFELPEAVYGRVSGDSPTLHTIDIPPQLTVHCPECRFVVPLHAAEITLGRGPNNSLIIPTPVVSTHHARLRVSMDGKQAHCTIEDLNSRNGIQLNGQHITPSQPYELKSGDQLRIGTDMTDQSVGLTYTALR
jgi:predicted component of type VI protein secretion system